MLGEIDPQEKTATGAEEGAESASAEKQSQDNETPENKDISSTEPETQISDKEPESKYDSETPAKSGKAKKQDGSDVSGVVNDLKAVRKRAQAAEQEAKKLRARLDNLEKKSQPEQQQTQSQPKAQVQDGPPQIGDFDSYDDFIEAKVLYRVKQERAVEEKVKQARMEEQRKKDLDRTFYKRSQKFSEDYPDYEDVLNSSEMVLHENVLDAIKESEIGPAIAYYLARNPNEAEKLAKLTASGAIREIGKLEIKLNPDAEPKKNNQKQATQAPEPIKPVSNLVSPEKKDMEKIPMSEYMRTRNTAMLERRNPQPR